MSWRLTMMMTILLSLFLLLVQHDVAAATTTTTCCAGAAFVTTTAAKTKPPDSATVTRIALLQQPQPHNQLLNRRRITTTESQRRSRPFTWLHMAIDDSTLNGLDGGSDDDDDDDDDAFLYNTPASSADGDDSQDTMYMKSESDQAMIANEMVAATATAEPTTPMTTELQTEISNSFLQYALSIIMGRAIPDIRDGLKPVHRRILYAMYGLSSSSATGSSSSTKYRKCARVVGEVLGKYHPHGDMAVYDALVRLAQSFTTNERLIDGYGNFGSIDADPAAAMRYTECRLSALTRQCLLDPADLAIAPMMPNFDGNEAEPAILPAKVPIILINGGAGIAVGMATNIPPHNLIEVMTACIALIKKERLAPDDDDGSDSTKKKKRKDGVTDKELFKMIPGPDFPTAANIMGTSGAQQLYKTGNGGIMIRGTCDLEPITTGKKRKKTSSSASTRNAIIVTELPYQVNKAALLEKIAGLVNEKKLEGISDLRDESSGRDGIRIVIELKRDAIPEIVVNNLYKKTPLQTTFAGNLLALLPASSGTTPSSASATETTDSDERSDIETLVAPTTDSDDDPNGLEINSIGGIDNDRLMTKMSPQRFTIRQALDCFLDFRFETIRQRCRYELNRLLRRLHIVNGLILARQEIDKIIRIVREASTMKDAKEKLSGLLFVVESKPGVSETQQRLTGEQIDAILKLQLGQLTQLNNEKLIDEKTTLETKRAELNDLIRNENTVYKVMIDESTRIIDKFGVKRKTRILMPDSATDFAGGNPLSADGATSFMQSTMMDSFGEINEMDMITNARSVVVVTRGGYIKRMPLKTFESQGRGTRGKRGTASTATGIATEAEEEEAGLPDASDVLHCFTCNDHDTLLIITQRGVAYPIRAYQVPVGGRTAKGQPIPYVIPSLQADDVENSITAILPIPSTDDEDVSSSSTKRSTGKTNTDGGGKKKNKYILLGTEAGWIKKTILAKQFQQITARGLTIATLAKTDKLKWCHLCDDENDDVFIGSSLGQATRYSLGEIRATGRTSRGVKAMKLRKGDTIADVNIINGGVATDLDVDESLDEKNAEDEVIDGDDASNDDADDDDTEYLLSITSQGYGKRMLTSDFRAQKRGGVGVIAHRFKKGLHKKDDAVVSMRPVRKHDEILLITAKGIIVRQKVSDIPCQRRTATGVVVQKIDRGDRISSVSLVPQKDIIVD